MTSHSNAVAVTEAPTPTVNFGFILRFVAVHFIDNTIQKVVGKVKENF